MTNVESPYLNNLSRNHQFQGHTNDCGPYCTAMAINTLKGTRLEGQTVAENLNDWRCKAWHQPLRRIPHSATFPWGITAFLTDYGLKTRWQIFTPFASLARLLDEGNLVITLTASLRHLLAHYRILGSIHHESMGFIDPAWPDGEIQYQSREKFLAGWVQTAHTMIAITLPD